MMLQRHAAFIRRLSRIKWLSSEGKRSPSNIGASTPLTVEEKKDSSVHVPLSYYMDTHSTVLQLQGAGYSPEQAETLTKVITQSLQSVMAPIERSVLSQRDLDLMELRVQRELETICSKLVLLEKTSLESLRNENRALKDRVEKLMSGFKEEVTKVQSNLQLDLNLEKGRIKEEATVLLQEIKDTNNRIDKEVALVRTQIEAQKLESVKYLAGVSLSIVTIVLSVVMGVWRLMK